MTGDRPSRTLFDTSAVISCFERQSDDLFGILRSLGRPMLRSITVVGELQHGAVSTGDGQLRRRRTLEKYSEMSQWSDTEISLDRVGDLFGHVSARATSMSVRLGMNDRWIIVDAVTQGATLVTSDRGQADVARAVMQHHGGLVDVLLAT